MNYTTDHLLLWSRGTAEVQGGPYCEAAGVQVLAVAVDPAVGWAGLSQGLSDHRGVACTLRLGGAGIGPPPPLPTPTFQRPKFTMFPMIPPELYLILAALVAALLAGEVVSLATVGVAAAVFVLVLAVSPLDAVLGL